MVILLVSCRHAVLFRSEFDASCVTCVNGFGHPREVRLPCRPSYKHTYPSGLKVGLRCASTDVAPIGVNRWPSVQFMSM